MQEERSILAVKNLTNVKVISVMALFSAISVIAGKFLAVPVGEYMRFSFENLPILLSGMAFGPICGMLTGIVSDLVGCVLVGYAINPIITVGAAVIGFVGGLIFRLFSSRKIIFSLLLSVVSAHLLGSVIIKSAGLSIYLGMPFVITVFWRVINYLCVAVAEILVLYFLFGHSGFKKQLSIITGGKK